MLLLLLHCKWCWNTHIYGSIRKQHSNWSTDNSFFTSFEELNGKFKVYLILRGRWIKNIFQFYILDWALRVILQFDYLIQNNLMVLIYRLPRKDKLIQFGLFSIAKNILRFPRVSKYFAYDLGTFTAKIGNLHRLWFLFATVKPSYVTRQWAEINLLRTSSKTKD